MENKKQSDINSQLIIQQQNQQEDEDACLKYFHNKGFKECQIIKKEETSLQKMGISIKAWDKQQKTYVVIKVLQGDNLNQISENINKIQEVKEKKSFIQPYLKQSSFLEDKYLYYITQFHKNQNLRQFSSKSKLNIDLVERIICKILIGLKHIHDLNMAHGRIKMENILIDKNESIKLTDFALVQDDNYLTESYQSQEEEKQEEEEEKQKEEKQKQKEQEEEDVLKQQKQDFYQVGLIIIYLTEQLKDREKELPQKLAYNSGRCYKLQGIANQIMSDTYDKYYFHIPAILERLEYFEENFLSFNFGFQTYEGEVQNGMKHGRGLTKYFNETIGFGLWQKNKLIFSYLYYLFDGDIYEKDIPQNGDYENNINGRIIWIKQKAIYEGELKDTYLYGQGTLVMDNIIQRGHFVNGRMNGYGEIIYANGDTFKGNIEDHRKKDYGHMIWSCGQDYKGQWKNDSIVGRGSYIFMDGSEYDGEVLKGLFHGQGTIYWNNGQKYEGQWVNHKRQGFGKQTEVLGSMFYEGYFLNNMKHGYGKQTSNGVIQEGQWKDNALVVDSESNKPQSKCSIF